MSLIKEILVIALIFVVACYAYPVDEDNIIDPYAPKISNNQPIKKTPKQDAGGEGTGAGGGDGEDQVPEIADRVLKIVGGALTGNINSILDGSYGLFRNPDTRKRVQGFWEAVAGQFAPTTTTKKPVQNLSGNVTIIPVFITTPSPKPTESASEGDGDDSDNEDGGGDFPSFLSREEE